MLHYIFEAPWPHFILHFTLFLFTTLWMSALARRFRTVDTDLGEVPFSIFDLQFPSSETELCKLLSSATSDGKWALRMHLLVDFLFMIAVYPMIAILCLALGEKTGMGKYFFWLIAALQMVAFLFDILENLYLLRRLRKPQVSGGFGRFTFFVYAKFMLAFLGVSVTLPVIFYFWMTGTTAAGTLQYIGIAILEVVVFMLISWRMGVAAKRKLAA